MAFYSVNTLSVTQGSAIVTGDETEFADFIDISWAIFIDKTVYFISSVDSQTQLTLAEPYTGPTKTNASFFCWPTQHLAVPLHIKTTDLIDTFGPLREDMNLLTQQITDTLAAQNVTLGYKQAVEIAKAAVDQALANTIAARDAAASSAATAAGHVVTTTANKDATEANKIAAAQSAADAAASKGAAAASETTTLGYKNATQTLRDQTQADKDATHADKLATDANLADTLAAKNDTLTALSDAEDARDEAIAAKVGAETARSGSLLSENNAAGSAQAAEGDAIDAAASAAAAETSKNGAAQLLNDTLAAKVEVMGFRDEMEADRDATHTDMLAAQSARDLAEQYAQTAQDPITDTAIIAALDYTPANVAGDDYTGNINMMDVDLNLYYGSGAVGSIDATSTDVRYYAYGTKGHFFQTAGGGDIRFPTGGGITVGPSNQVYHQGNLTKTTLGLGNVENKTSATIRGELTSSNVTTALAYTPVQQGTGVGQNTGNIVKIGWSGTRLKATVDSTDQGNIVFDSHLTPYAPLAGATFTGAISVPSDFTVRAQDANTEGAQIVMKKAPNQGLAGDIILDTQGNGVRIFDSVTTSRMLYFDAIGGQLTINGNYAFHDGRLPTKANVGLGNVDNTSDVNKPVSTAQQTALNGKLSLTGGDLTGNINMKDTDVVFYAGSTAISAIDTTSGYARYYAYGTNGHIFQTAGGGDVRVMSNGELRVGANNIVFHQGFKPTKSDVGLNLVDNTADANKSVNYATSSGYASSTDRLTKYVGGTTGWNLIDATMADNDAFRLRIGGDASNQGWVELATADDGNEPIYVRQYTGSFATVTRTATLLDGAGNTTFPGLVHSGGLQLQKHTSGNRPGVTKLYRKDDDSGYNVQTHWTGSYWQLRGYNADTFHAECYVERAGSAGYADSAGRAYPRRSDGGDLNFYWSGQGGQPNWLWGGGDGANMYVYNPSNFSVNYANSAWALSNSPGSAPHYSCRAWVNFYGKGAPISIRGSGNVSSITDYGVGRYGVNFSTAMPDTSYAVNAQTSDQSTGTVNMRRAAATQVRDLNTTWCYVHTIDITTSDSWNDGDVVMVSVFR